MRHTLARVSNDAAGENVPRGKIRETVGNSFASESKFEKMRRPFHSILSDARVCIVIRKIHTRTGGGRKIFRVAKK